MDVKIVGQYTLKLAAAVALAFCLIVSGATFFGAITALTMDDSEHLTTNIMLATGALAVLVATFFAGKWMRKNHPI